MRRRWEKRWAEGGEARQGQRLTAVGVVLPAGQADTCLLAGDGVPTEDPASALLVFSEVPSGAQNHHTVPGQRGAVNVRERGEERLQPEQKDLRRRRGKEAVRRSGGAGGHRSGGRPFPHVLGP